MCAHRKAIRTTEFHNGRDDDGTKPNTLATEKVIPPQDQTVQGSKRKEVSTVQMTVIRLTRKQLYDEIWEISAA